MTTNNIAELIAKLDNCNGADFTELSVIEKAIEAIRSQKQRVEELEIVARKLQTLADVCSYHVIGGKRGWERLEFSAFVSRVSSAFTSASRIKGQDCSDFLNLASKARESSRATATGYILIPCAIALEKAEAKLSAIQKAKDKFVQSGNCAIGQHDPAPDIFVSEVCAILSAIPQSQGGDDAKLD